MKSLYSDDQEIPFSQLFANPGALYRDTPFWGWNSRLDGEELHRQIGIFHQMGMGGFHMHARTGLGTPYLGPEFMKQVRQCVDDAKAGSMLAWLYDEDRFPSGAAGGLVTCDPAFRARHLLLTSTPRREAPDPANDDSGRLLAVYAIRFDQEHRLADYRLLADGDSAAPGFELFYAYLIVESRNPWFNDQVYVDTLNPRAIHRFVELTYEAYFKAVGDEFGKSIPAIFTDEPHFTHKTVLRFAAERRDVLLPYTDDLPETYRREYGAEFFDTLPELVWERADGAWSIARYRYHDHIAERFAVAFADTVGSWCERHGIRFSGHLLEEPRLESQTAVLGDVMRSYRSFQLPGIDMLCDWVELSTVKQAASASRQYGCGGVLSELDGVTDWDFSFAGHKGHGDWQAALGVTVRVPHLAWLSMAGEAKRDYPASISDQSPWWRKYPAIADHFARVNTAMSRGRALCRVGVIHPVESYWLVYGPQDQTAGARRQAEQDFSSLCSWVLHGLIDFDFIAESLLPTQNLMESGAVFKVGQMSYETVVVPPAITLRGTTLDRLEAFADAGGDLIFAGRIPVCCDAALSDRAARLAARCRRIDFSEAALLEALRERRDVEVVRRDDGFPASSLLYQLRDAGNERFLFLVNTERLGETFTGRVRIRGGWQLEFLDTVTGERKPLAAAHEHGWTVLEYDFYAHGHLLLRLTPAGASIGGELPRPPYADAEVEARILGRLNGFALPVTLDEPNVLVLDQAQWRTDGGSWEPAEEILRLDNLARAGFGLWPKSGHIVQPWVNPPDGKTYGRLELRYRIECAVPVTGAMLALEQPENTELELDGRPLTFADAGFWTDRSVRKTALPELAAGIHTLILRRDYRLDTDIERIYLLGDFGVELGGDRMRLTAPVRTLHWGDVTPQGLPFYSGNLTYHCKFTLAEAGATALRFPSRGTRLAEGLRNNDVARECDFAGFRATVIGVSVDGGEEQSVAFAPFQCELGTLAAGEHTLAITVYGSRVNSFGALHQSWQVPWMGPEAWRTEGDRFTRDYRVRRFGVMIAPLLVKGVGAGK